ncbi:hypothetical protein ILUMI_20007, partial [Ignelater luminosus]
MYFKLAVLFTIISALYVQSEPHDGIFINRLKSLRCHENDADGAVVLKRFYSKELPDVSLCGIHSDNNNTIESEWTNTGKFPWVVALLFKNKEIDKDEVVKCGGTIINRRFVLTSASCATNIKYE